MIYYAFYKKNMHAAITLKRKPKTLLQMGPWKERF